MGKISIMEKGMTAQDIYNLCELRMAQYAFRAIRDYMESVSEGDEDFDKPFFASFFAFMAKDPNALKNQEFSRLFFDLTAFALSYLEDSDDFAEDGKYPIGIKQADAEDLADVVSDDHQRTILNNLARELEFYESEYDCWVRDELEGYHYPNREDILDVIDPDYPYSLF